MERLLAACLFLFSGEPCSIANGPPAPSTGVHLSVKVWLEGPLVQGTPTLMNDSLRTLADFPLAEPYSALGFASAAGSGAETTSAGVLAVTGNDAIVDWVRIELRAAGTPTLLVDATHALLQRDGDVVDASDGISAVAMHVAPGIYHVVIRHRNHLACMTASAMTLGATATPIDFCSISTPTWGTAARKTVGGMMALWAGNTFYDSPLVNTVKYTNLYNDREPILTAIGGVVPTNTASGYLITDVNMDGRAKYTGSGNDREFILANIGGVVPTNFRVEQLP